MRKPSHKHTSTRRSPTLRAFIACEVSARTKKTIGELIEILRQQPGGEDMRWVPLKNLHVTLRFLGDISPLQIARLGQHLNEAIEKIPAFPIQLNAIKPFIARQSQILSISVTPSSALLQLAKAVEQGVQTTGWQPEKRPFSPHITIGRSLKTLPNFNAMPLKNIGAFTVREIVIFRSDLEKSGAIHTPLVRIPL